MSAEPTSTPADRPCPALPCAPLAPELPTPMLAGGGTTSAFIPVPVAVRPPAATAEGGGGTGLVRMSPVDVPPQLLRSRLTCEGGGATTAGAGSESLEFCVASRWGAETGGATTSAVCVKGTRELARSLCSSRTGGAMTVEVSELPVRILSRETFGVGGTMGVLKEDDVRLLELAISGAGAMTFIAGLLVERMVDEFNSGDGAATVIEGRVGAVSAERKPSAGGGPASALKASRLATAESE